MLKLAEMEYNGANSIFLRLLLDKKYALPFRVLDALVAHFLSFRSEKRVLPVLWHQSFLTLVQRYKADLASEQKEALLELLKIQTHPQISAEIRRELQNSESRDIEVGLPVTVEMVWSNPQSSCCKKDIVSNCDGGPSLDVFAHQMTSKYIYIVQLMIIQDHKEWLVAAI